MKQRIVFVLLEECASFHFPSSSKKETHFPHNCLTTLSILLPSKKILNEKNGEKTIEAKCMLCII